MPISSNRRQRVIDFATPKINDLVVVERVDCSKSVGSAATADDTPFGTAHPNTDRFPNFKLALIKSDDDEQGQFQLWYYVKDRADQDDYNWEFQEAGVESPRYTTVVRTYVIPRDSPSSAGSNIAGINFFDTNFPNVGFNVATDSENALKRGEQKGFNTYMPSGDPEITPFTGVQLSAGGHNSGSILFDKEYILFERKQVRSGDDFLDTLFVVEQRVYVKKVPIRRVDVDDSFPYNDPSSTAFSEADVTSNFGALPSKETLYHKNEPVYATTNFSDTSNNEGVTDTNVIVDGSDFGGDFDTAAHHVFADPDTVYSVTSSSDQADEYYNDGVGGSTKSYNFWGVDAYGIMREGRQLSDNWYAVVERQVIKPSKEEDTNNQVSKYTTYQNFSWPAVLTGTGEPNGDLDGALGGIGGYTWTRKNGGGDTVVFAEYARQAYSGPTKVEVTLFWRKKKFRMAPTGKDGADGGNNYLTKVVPMQPLPVSFVSPLETLHVPPTLHTEINLTITTGTDHPVWELAGANFIYAETNYTDWPESLIVSDTQKPYRGGWLRERVKAYAPITSKNMSLKDVKTT